MLLTPCGDPFFSLGVNAIDGGASADEAANPERAYRWQRFAGTRAEWAAGVRRRLLAWGFNTAGAWSVPPGEIGLPSTPELELGRTVQFVWTDPFDPALMPNCGARRRPPSRRIAAIRCASAISRTTRSAGGTGRSLSPF